MCGIPRRRPGLRKAVVRGVVGKLTAARKQKTLGNGINLPTQLPVNTSPLSDRAESGPTLIATSFTLPPIKAWSFSTLGAQLGRRLPDRNAAARHHASRVGARTHSSSNFHKLGLTARSPLAHALWAE